MAISKIAAAINPSATLRLNELAASLKKSGEPIIHLGGGEPSALAPAATVERGRVVLDSREVRYPQPAGLPELRELVASHTQKTTGLPIEADQVLITNGGKQALMTALLATVDPGDEVAYVSPYWVSYPEMMTLCGASSALVKPSDPCAQPALEDFAAAITDKTKAVILNSPQNPTGIVYTPELLKGVLDLCREKDLYLLADDIYHELVFDGRTPHRWQDLLGGESYDKLIVISGVSKHYAMTGFRIGWTISTPELRGCMTRILGHASQGPSPILQHAACGALAEGDADIAALRSALQSRRDVLMQELETVPGLSVTPPGGTFYCFVDGREIEPDSQKLAEMMLRDALVVAVPGIAFGCEGHLRVSFTQPEEQLKAAAERLRWLFNPDGPATLMVEGKELRRS
jgi:aspartate aminotransferase